MKRMVLVALAATLIGGVTAAASARNGAQAVQHPSGPNAVTHWSLVAQNAISVGRPPASSEVLNGLVHAAIYDAVVAVEGGYEPFAVSIRRSGPTSVDAAVAAAARGVLVIRVPGQASTVEMEYTAFIDGIPDGAQEDERDPPRSCGRRRVPRAAIRRRFRQRRAVGSADSGPGRVRAHSRGQHACRRQAQAGSALDVRRPRRASGRTARIR